MQLWSFGVPSKRGVQTSSDSQGQPRNQHGCSGAAQGGCYPLQRTMCPICNFLPGSSDAAYRQMHTTQTLSQISMQIGEHQDWPFSISLSGL